MSSVNPMQLAYLSCDRPIKIGPSDVTTYFSHDSYELELFPNGTVRIMEKRTGKVRRTSLFNVNDWTLFEDLPEAEQKVMAAARQGASHSGKKGSRQLEA